MFNKSIINDKKRCRHCGKLKSIDRFPKRKNGSIYQYCFFCNNARQKTKEPCEFKRLLKQNKFRCSRCSRILSVKKLANSNHYRRQCQKCVDLAKRKHSYCMYV